MRRHVLAIGIALVACGVAASGAFAGVESSGSRIVTKKQYGKRWPFLVARGLLSCRDDAVTFTTRGRTYGINGTALDRGFKRIEPIWRKDRLIPGARIDIGPILDRGLKLCGS